MKRLIVIFLALLMLGGCTYFDGNSQNGNPSDSTSDNQGNTDKVDDNLPDSNRPENDGESADGENGKFDENTEDPDHKDDFDNKENLDDNDTPEVSTEKITLKEYIVDLANGEYANDKSFLNFVAEMEDRQIGRILYASPNGEGDGSISSPMSIYDAVDSAKAGDTIYLRGGEYIFTEAIWISNSGKSDAYITLKSYPGEQAKLTTTPENVDKYDEGGEYIFFGIDGGVGYWIFEDLEIYGATDEYTAAFACYDGGQHHLIFKNNDIHDLKTTKTKGGTNAFLFLGEKKNSINNIMLIGNKCHNLTLGYSEAISFAGNCEYCYVVSNEVYDNNNIGIDFYGNAEYCSVDALDQARYCVAAYNLVYNCNSPYADCAGIYVDGGRNCLIENNLIYNCQYGIEIGSEEKKTEYPVTAITVRGNICRDNSVCAMRIGGYDTKTSGVVMNCEIYNNSFIDNTGDFDVIISMVDNIMFANNIFKTDGGFIETEFSSSYIKNLKFFNNCFDGKNEIEIFGKEINVEGLNAAYGSGNLPTKLNLDSTFKPETMLVGHSNYTMKYDIYFNKLTEPFIGAVS